MNKFALVCCMASLALTLFLAALDIVIVITLYDTIGQKFNDYSSIGWLVTGYSLPNALFTLLWGRFASLSGLKTSLVMSILIFELGSLIVAVSTSMGMLIGGRVVAGCGGSGIQSLVFAVGTSLVQEKNRGLVITALGLAFAIAFAVAPIIGGAFTENVTWRWCFYINLPVGGLALFLLLCTYNPTGKPWTHTVRDNGRAVIRAPYGNLFRAKFWHEFSHLLFFKLDFIGFALSSAGFVLFLLGFTFGGTQNAWDSGTIIAYITVGGILILLFVLFDFVLLPWYGRRNEHLPVSPLLSWSMCKIPGIFTSSFANFFCCFAFNMQIVYIVQFYQIVHNKGPTAASMHMWAFLVPVMLSIIIMGKVNQKLGLIKPGIVVGVVCGVAGSGVLTLISNDSTTGQVIGYSIMPGIAFGSIMQGSLLSAQVQVEKSDPLFHPKFIEATAINTFAKSLGMSFGGIFATMVFTNSVHDKFVQHNLDLSAYGSVEGLIVASEHHYQGPDSLVAKIITDAIRNVYYVSLGCSAISFMFGIFSSNKRLFYKQPQDLEKTETQDTIGKRESDSAPSSGQEDSQLDGQEECVAEPKLDISSTR
ncbi:LAMI_0B07008g1_1 [Lachancea mirantina]|uniref:LAMI_0B07008g1_1 n=1 Tax=Lachancea mirantina TaxID=1230905 RepID=A0A1G4IWW5_9SACH|nr:LAMI_0B07008g1_1 [Lachancea mirantina]